MFLEKSRHSPGMEEVVISVCLEHKRKMFLLLYYNLGVEMLYILNQRLVAQNITREKADQVLTDVILNYASSINYWMTSFLTEVKESNKQLSVLSFKNAFESVISSSAIMKLTPPSFDKLYDLMMGAFKFQLTRCPFPSSMYYLTQNHVSNLMNMASPLGSGVRNRAQTQIQDAFQAQFGQLTRYQWSILRNMLFTSILTDVNTRVSVLIRHGLQELDTGCYCIPISQTSPTRITHYDDDGEVIEEHGIYLNSLVEVTTLGEDIYLSELSEAANGAESVKCTSSNQNAKSSTFVTTSKPDKDQSKDEGQKEANLLINLLGNKDFNPDANNIALDFTFDSDEMTSHDDDQGFLNIGDEITEGSAVEKETVKSTHVQPRIDFNVDDDAESSIVDTTNVKGNVKGRNGRRLSSSKETEGDNDDMGDDLLALMDS